MQNYVVGQTVSTPVGNVTIADELSTGECAKTYAATRAGAKVLFKAYKNPVPDTTYCPYFPKYERCQQEIRKRLAQAPSHLIQVLGAFVADGTYHQLIEWATGRELEKILVDLNDSFSFEKALKIARVMVFGISEMHRVGIIHEDLKPDNVWLQEDASIGMGFRVKICDFDWSFLVAEEPPWGPRPGAGTDGYRSPEHFQMLLPTTASDMFTVGIMLYELFSGIHPLQSCIVDATTAEERDAAIWKAIKTHSIPALKTIAPERTGELAPKIAALIDRCFSLDPTKRPAARELHAALLVNVAQKRLVLTHKASGLKWRIQEATEFNRRFCTQMFNIDAGHVSRIQGRFTPNADKSKWFLSHEATATNATMINDTAMTSQTEIQDGMRVQVGNPATGNIVFEMEASFESV